MVPLRSSRGKPLWMDLEWLAAPPLNLTGLGMQWYPLTSAGITLTVKRLSGLTKLMTGDAAAEITITHFTNVLNGAASMGAGARR